ncbi:MAG: ATP synthase subunit I [Steroidobacteraceae bacterium]
MAGVEIPDARRVALGIVVGQATLTAIVAAVCYLLFGPRAGLSAALGGGIGTAASLALALIAFRGGQQSPQRIARAFFVGEAAKVAVVVALFVVVLTAMEVVPAALFGAYVATFFVYWAALARALPAFGRSGSK